MSTGADPAPPLHGARRVVAAATLAVLLLLTALAAVLPPGPADRAEDGSDAAVEAGGNSLTELSPDHLRAIADSGDHVDYLTRQELGERGMEALAKGIVVPSADTVMMRHLGVMPNLPYDVVQRFQAVALSNDEGFRAAELARLAAHSIPVVRYRAFLEMARSGLRRSGGRITDEVRVDIDRALAVPGVEKHLTVDALLLLALHHRQEGDFRKAHTLIGRVLEADPQFLWAHWERVAMVAALLDGQDRGRPGAPSRSHLLGELIRSLNAIAVLARGRNAVDDLRAAATPLLVSADGNARFALGYVHFIAGQAASARDVLAGVEPACRARSAACAPEVIEATRTLLELLDDSE